MDQVDSRKFDINDVFNVYTGNIGARSHIIIITINAVIFYTYNTLYVLKALRKELDDLIANGIISNPVTFKKA